MPAPRHAIFISYRRRETAFAVDELYRALRTAFGDEAVFRDVESIRKGQNFPDDIRAALNEARVGIVVVGPWWLTAGEESSSQRRLLDPNDWVRIEIETLLQRQHGGSLIPVIPLFIGGAQLPQDKDLPDTLRPLTKRNGMKLEPFPDTDHSIQLIIENIAGILGILPQPWSPATSEIRDIPPRISPSRLGVSGKKFVGREQELHLLDEAWGRSADDKINVISFIGQGGEGKTAVVLEWSSRRARRGWPGVRRVFEWSFYSQGTSAQSSASADEFFSKAFEWFGHRGEVSNDPRDKGAKLAELVAAERTLLVLDGLEPLQQPPGGYGGEFKDLAMRALVRGLARYNPGLCILTSRVDIADLTNFERADGPCMRHSLHALDRVSARLLLWEFGVHGRDKDFDDAISWFHGHAYDLNLLGNYLAQCTTDHDIRGWQERFPILREDERIHPVPDATGKRAGHGRRMLRAYVRWLGEDSPAAAVLRLLGLFDRPARSDLLDELRTEPVISNLTHALVGLADDEWLRTLGQLEQLALITRERLLLPVEEQHAKRQRQPVSFAVDAHPLLREHFAHELREQMSDSWSAAHRRLYEYLCTTTPDKDKPTLEDLQPLYQAVAHGCKAGLQQEACDEVYFARITRGSEFYSAYQLGAIASDLGAVACFFATPWSRVSPSFNETDQAWLLNEAAFRLRGLGRLTEALEPMRAASQMFVAQGNWNAVVGAVAFSNLSELELTLGKIAGSIRHAEQAVSYADSSGEAFHRVGKRTTYADSLHQAGRTGEAEARFGEAEQMQKEWQPEYPLLYSLQGFRYCELLLAIPECAAWRLVNQQQLSQSGNKSPHFKALRDVSERAALTLKWAGISAQGSLLTIALDQLTLGREALYEAVLTSTASPLRIQNKKLTSALDDAVNSLRRSGIMDHLARGLLTRAWLRFLNGVHTGPESAQEDLDEAWEIAERGPMRLHLADIHLYRARLFLREAEYPWESPQKDLEEAERLINECGYHRRDEELADAKRAILNNPR